MPAPKNKFKAALAEGQLQVGAWMALADTYVAEITAHAGFDWLVVDAEHAPNDLRSIVAQLQVIAASQSSAVVRPPIGSEWQIKQLLDAGAQTLLIPMVETAEQAQSLVEAMRYPPRGRRGVGAALGRASGFAATEDYLTTAEDELCLLVQIESRAGVDAIEEIAAVDGVDGLFIGPADLAADMGYLHDLAHPDVRDAINGALRRIAATGKAAGILNLAPEDAQNSVANGARFVATTIDVLTFGAAIRQAAAQAQNLKGT